MGLPPGLRYRIHLVQRKGILGCQVNEQTVRIYSYTEYARILYKY